MTRWQTAIDGNVSKSIERNRENDLRFPYPCSTGLSSGGDAPRNSVQVADFDIPISLGSLYIRSERRRSSISIPGIECVSTRPAFRFISFLFRDATKKSIVSPIIPDRVN